MVGQSLQVPGRATATVLNLTVAAAVFVATLLAGDRLICLLLPVPGPGYGVWAAYPGSLVEVKIRPDGVQHVHRYNNLGFRGASVSPSPPRGGRVIAVGDSYTEGTGVAEEETWPTFLQAELSRAVEVEVLNLGDGGSAPDQYARIISRLAIALRPTHLIVCWTTSDLRFGPVVPPELEVLTELPDPFRDERPTWQAPLVMLFPGLTYLVERSERWPVQRGTLWTRFDDRHVEMATSRVARLEGVSRQRARELVDARLADLDPSLVAAARQGELNPALVRFALSDPLSYRVTTDDMEIGPAELSESVRRWLSWYLDTARRHGVQPWLLYYPEPALVVDRGWGPSIESHLPRPAVFGDTSVRDLLRSHCDDLGLPFIDATRVLRAHAAHDLYLAYDTHPTAAAHRLVAMEVAARLRPALAAKTPPQG